MSLLFLCVSVGTAAAPTLTFAFRDIHANKTALETDTYGINNKGVIVGDYVDSNGTQHGMILAGQKLTRVDRPDCAKTHYAGIAFYGINSAGVAAGGCTNKSGTQIGFTYANGKFTDIKIKSATALNAYGINDKGAVVGYYVNSSGIQQHGFLLVGSKLTRLDPPGVIYSATAWGINNKGVITVLGVNSNGTWVSFTTGDKGKTYKPFHAPREDGFGTFIREINNKGDILGSYVDAKDFIHGVLFHGGKYYSFMDPKGSDTNAYGMNDNLTIVGLYDLDGGYFQGFEGTTKP
jgi:uncharacterized membrane protein